MAHSPPASPLPGSLPSRPTSATVKPAARCNSRMSVSSKVGGYSRSDEDGGRTAVKVAVRVRPPLNHSDPGFDLIPQRFQRSMVHTTSATNLTIDTAQGRKLFVFDRVFGPDVMQEGIWEYLNESVNAFIQGYNVSLLAYGQSGSGKSYTMGTSGPLDKEDSHNHGVIPRAAIALFEKLDGAQSSRNPTHGVLSQLRAPVRYSMQPPTQPKAEKNWKLRATYVEIYNEQLRDLLVPESTPLNERGNVAIREDIKGNIILTGLHQLDINSVDDLMSALDFGSSIRQTDSTNINAKSSRSHAVFSLNLVQRKAKGQVGSSIHDRRLSMPVEGLSGSEAVITTDSKLHFVDLAGSERLKNTGAQGERAREGISINAGLAALGKVISQLSSRNQGAHVSYRDSKLTRLLQDSLGGNAITYMIACVTPAEFHLSETLNTLQYAQRARAIQSKPRIQQIEEGDKQAIIDRLKAEVIFLREQIRSAENSGGRMHGLGAVHERSERQMEREAELQDQLLDSQENYTSLSQRHAKLIAELAKAREHEAAGQEDSANERLNRSNSFAKAVEQVVMEYEKTIQTLEQSLSSTRTTLSNTETSLLEKETKCAYVETINAQLQSRLRKLTERESNTENYLQELESKLEGQSSGEEKNAEIVTELRKEMARLRENEATCEEYISTLEERLAEADQDQELMQREMDRLEQVIERQRSLGKLDSLLYDLDNIAPDGAAAESGVEPRNGFGHRRAASDRSASSAHMGHSRRQSMATRDRRATLPGVGEEAAEEVDEQGPTPAASPQAASPQAGTPVSAGTKALKVETKKMLAKDAEPPTSPAQCKFVNDKLDNVTRELVELRIEHETTLNEYDLLQAKYEDTVRHLAELQDVVDEARHPSRGRNSSLSALETNDTQPMSFLCDARSSDPTCGTQLSSRSLLSELSSAMESRATMESPDDQGMHKSSESKDTPRQAARGITNGEDLVAELDKLKRLAAEKEAAERELTARYSQLEEEYNETLDIVEELKTQVAKAKYAEPPSPRSGTPVIRRKSSQNIFGMDRVHRSFASLRNIATEHLQDNPDQMQAFELNLNSVMHELHGRSERIQELEADVANAKKEMEAKMTIILGLTRERSSMKQSSSDMTIVATMREQLERNEARMRTMQEAHAAREKELLGELERLKQSVQDRTKSASTSDQVDPVSDAPRAGQGSKIAELESELANWEGRHKTALGSMQAGEEQMKQTIVDLEAAVAALNHKLSHTRTTQQGEEAAVESRAEDEKAEGLLRKQIDEYKSLLERHSAKVAELEAAHSSARSQLEEATQLRDRAAAEANHHKQLVGRLESQLAEHERALKSHQDKLNQLHADHATHIDEIQARSQVQYDGDLQALMMTHAEKVELLERELDETREHLIEVATQVAEALGLDVSLDKISERVEQLLEHAEELSKKADEAEVHARELETINDSIVRELQTVNSQLQGMLAEDGDKAMGTSPSPPDHVAAVAKKMAELEAKNVKNSRLVEELEDQLQTNFDQAQLASKRLSTMQTERNSRLDDVMAEKVRLQAALESVQEEYAALQVRLEVVDQHSSLQKRLTAQQSRFEDSHKRTSINSQMRKTTPSGAKPTPPPAIPLPALPGTATANRTVPTSPVNGRPTSYDIALQIREEQEDRIRTLDRHLAAEKQLTATLEEALTDLERQQNKLKADCDAWRKRAKELEDEVKVLKARPQLDSKWRDSLHQVEEERKKRQDAERARAHLEERMRDLNKKKKKGSLNCF